MNPKAWENFVNHQRRLIIANEGSSTYAWLRINTLMASLLNEVIVITQPGNLFSAAPGFVVGVIWVDGPW
jgi:hypothetical protein